MSSKYGSIQKYVVVRKNGSFVFPSGKSVIGKGAWLDERLLHSDRAYANRQAEQHDAQVEKIRISAYRIGWTTLKDEVPRAGDVAFSQGWDSTANPHPKGSVEWVWWLADWWVANATAFQSHVERADTE